MQKRIDFFDYLRAIAVTFVVVAHYRNPILPGGSIGVSMFFALSGYLICSLLLNQEGELSLASCARFSIRRFLRIFPPYLISLALIFMMMSLCDRAAISEYFYYLPGLLTFTYRPDHWINLGLGVLWTLHVEFWFYVTFPLLVFVCKRFSFDLILALVCLIPISWVLTYLAISSGLSSAPPPSPLSAAMWMDCLLFGSIVAGLQDRGLLHRIAKVSRPLIVACAIALLAIALFIPNSTDWTWILEARGAALLTSIILAAFLANPFSFSIPAIAWIGRVSYPIYLLHGIPAGYVEIPWMSHARSIPMIIMVIAASALMHYLIELPSIRFARAATASLRTASAAT